MSFASAVVLCALFMRGFNNVFVAAAVAIVCVFFCTGSLDTHIAFINIRSIEFIHFDTVNIVVVLIVAHSTTF